MKMLFILLCVFIGNVALADVEYAYVTKRAKRVIYWKMRSVAVRSSADKKNYAKAFEGIDVWRDGEKTEDGVFGIPTQLVVKSNNKCYFVFVNNAYGVFCVVPAKRIGDGWVRRNDKYRDIYLPRLYDNLKEMGLKILTPEEILEKLESGASGH